MSGTPRAPSDPDDPRPRIAERSVAAAHRVRSLQSRAGSILSLGVGCAVGLALLVWYYGTTLRRPARAADTARALAEGRAKEEMPLPPLPALAEVGRQLSSAGRDRTDGPDRRSTERVPPSSPARAGASRPAAGASVDATLRGLDRPIPWLGELPPRAKEDARVRAGRSGAPGTRRPALQRRLSGPVFATRSDSAGSSGNAASGALAASPSGPASSGTALPTDAAPLAQLLRPTETPAADARVLPTRTLLLPKGTFIDCTLETAIDSTLPGMTTCITATDTFSADGKVVLIERGSKLVGETRGEVRQGGARVFVLWTEARTPTGVVIPLASPGTDELGRSGLPGTVSRHFLERFGAALLISIIDAGAQAAAQSTGGTVIYGPGPSQGVVTEVLRDTLRIPPTVVKHQGDRIEVLVARDIDFRSVYELRAAIGR